MSRERPGRLMGKAQPSGPRPRGGAARGGALLPGPPSPLPLRSRGAGGFALAQPTSHGPPERAGAPTWMQLMMKAWPRNTLRSAPDWASKARARASPLPVNTVNTRRHLPPAREPSSPRDSAGRGAWMDRAGRVPGTLSGTHPLASQGCHNCKWETAEAPLKEGGGTFPISVLSCEFRVTPRVPEAPSVGCSRLCRTSAAPSPLGQVSLPSPSRCFHPSRVPPGPSFLLRPFGGNLW